MVIDSLLQSPTSRAPSRFSDSLYHQMFEQNNAVQLLIDAQSGHVFDANAAACRFYGYPSTTLCGLNIRTLNGMAESEVEQTLAAIKVGALPTFVRQHRLASGEVRDVSVTSSVLTVNTATIIHSVIQDITEQRCAEAALRESEERYRRLVAALHDGIVLQQSDGTIVTNNSRAEEILGLSADQLRGRDSVDPRWQAVHADGTSFPGETHPAMVALRTGQPVENVTMGVYKPDGNLTWILVNAQPLFKGYAQFGVSSQTVQGVVTSFTDITQLKEIERNLTRVQQNLEEERDFAQLVMNTMGQGLVILDTDHRLTYTNPAYARMLGYSQDALIGKTPRMFTHPDDLAIVDQVRRERERGATTTCELRHFRADGTPIYVEVTSAPYLHDGVLAGDISVITDISERKRAQALLAHHADYDLLTDLPNRKLFRQNLDAALDYAIVNVTQVAVGFIDLDGFKTVNDTLGHAAGDLLLQQVAQRIRTHLPSASTAARIGGDEFTFMLNDITGSVMAQEIAERILADIRQPFNLAGQIAHIGASIGLALYPNDATEGMTLLQKADTAMYAVKHSGKNAVRMSGAS